MPTSYNHGDFEMSIESNMALTCRNCGKEFIFTKSEQEFYEEKGFTLPHRCKECRSARQLQHQPLVCSQCKTELAKEDSIYCHACLASVHLEFELEIRQRQKAADEAQTKLLESESQGAKLAEQLSQKEHLIAELEKKLRNVSQELEKIRQFHTDLQWIYPAVDGLQKRLEVLEYGQNGINQRILHLAETIHELYENINILEIIKHTFRHYLPKEPRPNSPVR
jgi:hypothetical protein